MISNLITQPYNIILDPTGGGGRAKPVANGKLYYGEIDKDPINNPIDVFYKDETGTEVKLTQPLRTNSSGAFIDQNTGVIIQPYSKMLGYSVQILDKNTNPVYKDLHVGDQGNVSNEINFGDSALSGGLIFPSSGYLSLGAKSILEIIGATRINVDVSTQQDGSKVETLYLWEPSGDFASSSQNITNIVKNDTNGYNVITNVSSYEFLTKSVYDLRKEGFSSGWGAIKDADNTKAIQAASDYLFSIGGGEVLVPVGISYLSLANSRHVQPKLGQPTVCLLLRENVTLKGYGKGVTVFQRAINERAQDGILMCNANFDSHGGYLAEGSIVIDGFSITDGAASPNSARGNLVGIGHCDGFIARNIEGLNHDQHLFDICASQNVIIEETCSGNNAVNDISTATVQIDGATSFGIWGAFQDSTATKRIKIRGKYKNIGAKRTIDLCHADNIDYEDIDIDCEIDGAYVENSSCIGFDDTKKNVNVKNLKVRGTYKSTHSTSIPVKLLLDPASGKKVDEVDIDVTVNSVGRGGVLVGQSTNAVSGRWGAVRSKVIGRIISQYTGSNTEVFGVQYTAIDNLFMSPEDDIAIVKTSTTGVSVMAAALIQDCVGDSDGGRYSCNLTNGGSNKRVGPFIMRHFFKVIKNFKFTVRKPILECFSGCGHHFLGEDEFGSKLTISDEIVLSEATFRGLAQISNIHEPFTISNGTSGFRQIKLDGSTYDAFKIDKGNIYTGRNLNMKKTGADPSLVNLKIAYGPTKTTVDTDQEEINFAYISSTSCVGVQIVDINLPSGSFSVITGSTGVTSVIDNSAFYPFIRAEGYIKIWASI